MEINKSKSVASDLENKWVLALVINPMHGEICRLFPPNRLIAEREKNIKNVDEINVLRQELMNKDQDYQKAVQALVKPKEDLESLQSEHDVMVREYENVKRRYEREQLQRQEAEDKAHMADQNMEFQKKVHEEVGKKNRVKVHV